MDRYWFRPHRYGLGASPKTWEGWVAVAVYLGAIVGFAFLTGAPLLAGEAKPFSFLVIVGVLTLIFLVLCWRKTEGGWRWRWGED